MADARGAQWTKLVFNAATNPVGALTGLPHGWACEREDIRELVRALVAEGRAVADSLGIEFDSDPDALVDHATKVAHDHKASMLQDVEARRPTEVDYLNGGISRFGREQGIPTPLNDALWALVKGLERSWTRQEAP
jgi:2-dehydropantoate 2-reductase